MPRDNVFPDNSQPQWWSSRRDGEDVPPRPGPDAPGGPPTPAAPVDTHSPMQRLYLRVWSRLDNADAAHKPKGNGLWPLVTLVLFALALTGNFDVSGIILLVGVVLFHELGHYTAMRLFGYSDVRIFFIPFFGGAAMGKKYAAPGWQQAIVLLAGPLPGILVAAAALLARGWNPNDPPWLQETIAMLLIINGFNLLPVLPLDGGRLLSLLIFSRHPMLEMLFRLFTTVAGGLFAFFARSWFFGLITLQMLTSIGSTYRQAVARRRLRQDFPNMPANLEQTDEEIRWALVEEARHVWRSVPDDRIDDNANVDLFTNTVRQLHEGTVTRAPGLLATPFLLGIYGCSVLAVPATGVFIALAMESVEYHARVEDDLVAWETSLHRIETNLEHLTERIDGFEEQPNPAANMQFVIAITHALADAEADLVITRKEITAAENEAEDQLRRFFEESPDQREHMATLKERSAELIQEVEQLRDALVDAASGEAPDPDSPLAVEGEVA